MHSDVGGAIAPSYRRPGTHNPETTTMDKRADLKRTERQLREQIANFRGSDRLPRDEAHSRGKVVTVENAEPTDTQPPLVRITPPTPSS